MATTHSSCPLASNHLKNGLDDESTVSLTIGPRQFPFFPRIRGSLIKLNSRMQFEHKPNGPSSHLLPAHKDRSHVEKAGSTKKTPVQSLEYRRCCCSRPVPGRAEGTRADIQICTGLSGQWLCSQLNGPLWVIPFPIEGVGRHLGPGDLKSSFQACYLLGVTWSSLHSNELWAVRKGRERKYGAEMRVPT